VEVNGLRAQPRSANREAPRERLVMDLNGSADAGDGPPTRVNLIAHGSTDGAESSVIVVRQYAEEPHP
jgi:hypothetical protein